MPNKHDQYSNARLAEAGQQAGYASTLNQESIQNGVQADEMFRGRLSYESYSSGVSVYFSDMESLVESQHEGVIDRSWTLAINLGHELSTLGLGERNRLELAPSEAKVVCASDQMHMANRVAPGLRCRSLLLRLSPEAIRDEELAEEMERFTRQSEVSEAIMTTRLGYLATCLTEPSPSTLPERLLAESRALELVAHVLGQVNDLELGKLHGLSQHDRLAVKRVRDVIHANPSRDFTLQELAAEAGMSLSSLKAKFPDAFGETVFSYLRGVRLDYAREQITQNGWTITQAAHFAGYTHVGNFSKAFRKRFGVRPIDIR